MKQIELDERWFQGAVSVERKSEGWMPWRAPYDRIALFTPAGLNGKAADAAGVRLGLLSDTATIKVTIVPQDQDVQLDGVIDNELVATQTIAAGSSEAIFADLPQQEKRLEIYLSQKRPVVVTQVEVDDSAAAAPLEGSRKRWITYGSSITQCGAASSPAMTWPAIVARKNDFHLTCLGYGGNCHLEPMVALTIRDLPADYISLCLGINIYGGSSYGPRTFQAASIGFIQIIREKHPHTPLVVMSPIYSVQRETNPNAVGFTLVQMREQLQAVVEILRANGDQHIYYADGLEVLGEQYAQYLPDNLHPNAEGYRLMAEGIQRAVVEPYFK